MTANTTAFCTLRCKVQVVVLTGESLCVAINSTPTLDHVQKALRGSGGRSVLNGISLLLVKVQSQSVGCRRVVLPIHSWTWKYEHNLWYLADADVGVNVLICTYVEHVITFLVNCRNRNIISPTSSSLPYRPTTSFPPQLVNSSSNDSSRNTLAIVLVLSLC